MTPLLASGHGVEFLLAKLAIEGRRVRLEVTADCEGNLMLPDRAAARAAMERLFVVGREGEPGQAVWTELAPLRFEQRTKVDETAPLPPDPTWAGRPHDLLTGIWEWAPPEGERFQLGVPNGEPMDTLLWRVETGVEEGTPVKWKMLISGDETEWLGPVVGEVAGFWWGWGGWVLGGVLVMGLMWGVKRGARV
jgi:hypothetical protein